MGAIGMPGMQLEEAEELRNPGTEERVPEILSF
jgi:hypothetical protein